jgi:hypothetical protein
MTLVASAVFDHGMERAIDKRGSEDCRRRTSEHTKIRFDYEFGIS